jgi:5,10-methylene-tetrahydrofolate dehydrogenase/methenyl tetrahydrofolate cyclohydrolase
MHGYQFPGDLHLHNPVCIAKTYIEASKPFTPVFPSPQSTLHKAIMIDLSNKVIVLTGGASGIGRATALLLASLGAKLSIADLQQEALESVAKEIKAAGHGDVLTTKVDVRQADAVEAWIQETVKWAGRIDGAANLAGVIGKSIGLAGVCSIRSLTLR